MDRRAAADAGRCAFTLATKRFLRDRGGLAPDGKGDSDAGSLSGDGEGQPLLQAEAAQVDWPAPGARLDGARCAGRTRPWAPAPSSTGRRS